MREDLAQSHRSWGRVNLELRSQDSVGGRVTAYSGQWQIQLRESGLNERVQETLQMFRDDFGNQAPDGKCANGQQNEKTPKLAQHKGPKEAMPEMGLMDGPHRRCGEESWPP